MGFADEPNREVGTSTIFQQVQNFIFQKTFLQIKSLEFLYFKQKDPLEGRQFTLTLKATQILKDHFHPKVTRNSKKPPRRTTHVEGQSNLRVAIIVIKAISMKIDINRNFIT